MLFRRIFYAITLLASIAAFILTDSGVALFFLICLILFPLTSFVALLFARNRVRFDYETRDSCIRGGSLQITMRVGLRPRVLAGCVKVIAEIENTTFHKTTCRSFVFNDLSYAPHTYDFKSADSGRINVRFKKLQLIDLLGICSLSVKRADFAESIVSPVLYDDIQTHIGIKTRASLSGENSLPQKGNDHSEIFDIRDYVPGDALNSVHWKLSSKFDSLVSKEYGSTDDHHTLILVDMSRNKENNVASDEQLNAVLDIAVSISDALKMEKYAHSVGWFNDGSFYSSEVSDSDSFVSMVYALMSIKVEEGNTETLFYFSREEACASFTKIIFVTSSVSSAELKEHRGLDMTVLAVNDMVGQYD
ncbi:MAG: DUF58 domain-containing protein, partial [Firmicutes bacterium]|nr:DUF58 domain-containing protein [Bacillota bacterium]